MIAALRACGPLQIAPTKSGINLLSRTSLGGMNLRRAAVNLGLVLTRRVDHPRVLGVLQISPRTFVHRLRLTSRTQVDARLRAWLCEAHQVGMMAGRRVG